MRPPILFITIGFAIGLVLGEGGRGTGDGYLVAPILATALLFARRAPLGAAVGVMGVAGGEGEGGGGDPSCDRAADRSGTRQRRARGCRRSGRDAVWGCVAAAVAGS